MNARGIILVTVGLVIAVAIITTKSCKRTVTVCHGTGYHTTEEKWLKNKIVELIYYKVLPINSCYCCDETGRKIWYSKKDIYLTQGDDTSWGLFDQSRGRAIDLCKRTGNDLIEISHFIRKGDLRNLDDDDELKVASNDSDHDMIVIIKYFRNVAHSSIPEISYGRVTLGNSESLMTMK